MGQGVGLGRLYACFGEQRPPVESTRRWRTLGSHSNAQWCSPRHPLLLLLFVNDSPDVLEALTLLFADDDSVDTEHEPSQLSYCCMGLVEEMGPTDQSYQMQLSHNRDRSSPEIVFFPNGSGTPISVSKLVNDLGVKTSNKFSPSAQLIGAANKS